MITHYDRYGDGGTWGAFYVFGETNTKIAGHVDGSDHKKEKGSPEMPQI